MRTQAGQQGLALTAAPAKLNYCFIVQTHPGAILLPTNVPVRLF